MQKGIKLETLRELAEVGTAREAILVAEGHQWRVMVRAGMAERPLVAHRGNVRRFANLETAVTLLRGAGIGRIVLDAANFSAAA